MLIRRKLRLALIVCAAFLVSIPAFAQVQPDATGGAIPNNDTQMMTPPPVSGMPYASSPGSEVRANYLSANLAVTPGYIDNVLVGSAAAPVGDFTTSILPMISLSRQTSRQQEQISYSPSFIFYNPTSALDSFNQGASLTFQFRLSPHVSLSLLDSFTRTSNVYDQSNVFSNAITGSTQNPGTIVIAPFAEQLTNSLNGVVSYQFSRDAMIGGGASFTKYDLPNPAEAAGLFNSNAGGGTAFYARRFSLTHYAGLTYQYERTLAYPAVGVSDTQTNSLLAFYTHYFNHAFSISVSGGIEHLNNTTPQSPSSDSSSPTAAASVGWQSGRGNLAVSYSRTVTAGGGLLGAYSASIVTGTGGWKLSRAWDGGLTGTYSNISNATPGIAASIQGGNTLTASATLGRTIGEHFTANFQYQHLHENYNGIAVISANPDSNRESVTITYQFRRPLGR